MLGKKLKALALISAAVMSMASITASADVPTIYGFDNLEKLRTETVDTHICQNYINFDINCGSYKGKKMLIRDQSGNIVAKYTTGENKFSYVREGVLDISGMTSPKQIDALKTDSKYVTRAIQGEKFVLGQNCVVTWRNEYLPYIMESTEGKEVYPLLSSQIYVYTVDNKAMFEDMNETYTVRAGDYAAYVDHSCSSVDENIYFNFKKFYDHMIIREHAGEFLYDTMQEDTYSPNLMVYMEKTPQGSKSTGGSIQNGLQKQDHDVTYKMYRIKFEDLIKNSCYYTTDYEKYLSYGREPGKFAVLFASGSMMTYVTPDNEGYMKFWADPNKLDSIQFDCVARDLTGTSGKVTMYRVIKLNPVMTMPNGGLTLYNIPAGTYKLEFEDPADKEAYIISNSTFTVKDSTKLQTATQITVWKDYFRPGDVNADKRIDVEDAVMVIGHINGNKALTDSESRRGDIDTNSVIDIEDAVAIIAHVNGVTPIA